LKATYHKFQARILGSPWKDKVRNEEVKEKTALQKLALIINERRLRWCISQMDDGRLAKQVMHWEVNTIKQRTGRSRKNWINTI